MTDDAAIVLEQKLENLVGLGCEMDFRMSVRHQNSEPAPTR